MDYIAQPKDYWIAQQAIDITLNALDNPNRINGTLLTGAAILCYIDGVEGLDYDAGHHFKTWPLTFSPTRFNNNNVKYVYVAIPRTEQIGTQAVVVFPEEQLDVYGMNASDEQVGSADYYYIWLQGVISDTDGTTPRTWSQQVDFGKKGTDEDLYDFSETDWYLYSKVTNTVTFLKKIVMQAGSYFQNIFLGSRELTGVATGATTAEYVDSEVLVATPSYIKANYLSKKSEDQAQEQIGFLKGLWVGDSFYSGILGDGGCFRKDADGKTYIEADKMYIRMKAYFDNVEIREYQHTGGNRIASQAQGFTCSRVEWIDANGDVLEQDVANLPNVVLFRCYWRVDDGEKKTDNQFIVGDLAYCKSSEVTDNAIQTKAYWRLVVGRNSGNTTTDDGEAWIDISNAHDVNGNPVMTTITWEGQGGVEQSMSVLSFQGSSDIPTPEDDICQLGNVRDETRQGAIIEYVSGEDAPSYQIYQGIGDNAENPYSLIDKNQIEIGYNSQTGHAHLTVYGDMYIGTRPNEDGGYVRYDQDTRALEVNGKLNVGSTLADGRDVNALGTSKGNILLNTSFTGDYDSEDVDANTDVTPDTIIYSDPLKHWNVNGVTVIESGESQSGYAAVIASGGSLAQNVTLEIGKWYVLSFRGSGGTISYSIGGVTGSLALKSSVDAYDVPFVCGGNSGLTINASSTVTLMELQLCEGNLPSAWKQNYSDGEKTMAAVNEYKYISDAIKNASTDIIGGLILSQIIKVGNYRNKQMTEETGGMSGVWIDDNSPFLWGGGNMSQAIYTIMKYANDPSYEPTQEEIAAMAKYVITHGGRAILNDVILRGYIYALGGHFKGKITAQSGEIGGFDIDDDNLTNKNYDAGISIQDAQNDPTKLVQIGSEATDTLTGRKAAMVARATESNTGERPYNTALFLEAKNATYNYAIHGEGNNVLNGYTQGYKVNVLDNIGTETYLSLNDGKVQAIASVNIDTDKWIFLPTLGDCCKTLGIDDSNTSAIIDFCCEMTIINQSAIQSSTSYNRDNVYIKGDEHAYNAQITSLTARPVVLAQGNPKKIELNNCTTCNVVITYINKRFIANYVKTVW